MIQAKMMVATVTEGNGWDEVRLYPVYSSDPTDPNYSYSQATPSGELKLMISNPDLIGKVKQGQTYLIDMHLQGPPDDKLPEVRGHSVPTPEAPANPKPAPAGTASPSAPTPTPASAAPASDQTSTAGSAPTPPTPSPTSVPSPS